MKQRIADFLEQNHIIGNISIKTRENAVFVSGHVCTHSEADYNRLLEFITDCYRDYIPLISLSKQKTIVEIDDEQVFRGEQYNNPELDEVKIIYVGMIDTDKIKQTDTYKTINRINKLKIDNVVKVLRSISPIILNSNLEIIDGNLRVQLAVENDIREIPCVIYDCSKEKQDTLRLLLNRSCEFQRWDFTQIDPFVDSHPQLQPILEPLGFFGTTVLPESYFTNTVIDYVIDPFNEKQRQYRQEDGIAEWAKYRRQQMEEKVKERYAKKPAKDKSNLVSLFDLSPSDSDFIPTYDAEAEIEQEEERQRALNDEITTKYDKERKELFEATGREWQLKSRLNKDVAREAREKFVEYIQKSPLSDLQKNIVMKDIDKYANMKITEIKENLKEYANEHN